MMIKEKDQVISCPLLPQILVPRLTEVKPSVIFGNCSSDKSKFDVLCMLRYSSAHHGCKQ